ncbi:CML24 [Symbiodinium necroappetens]|uniref:CML24 protein n=1 Tax=Symbiodinium necroappetens TaxID=1628268 RepID=A0A812P2J0_9DINO|nr:CML24 [Symbiodinium necroappetens]
MIAEYFRRFYMNSRGSVRSGESEDEGVDMEEGGESEQEIEDDAEIEVDGDEKKDPLAPALRAQLVELEEQEQQLSLLLELQELHDQEALLLVQDLEEREAMQLAVALSESEAEAKVRDCEEAKLAESSVATGEPSGDKLVSFASAENIATNLIENSARAPDVSISPHDAETQHIFGEIPKLDASDASDAKQLPEAAVPIAAKLARAVPLASDDEENCEEQEEEEEEEEEGSESPSGVVLRADEELQEDDCVGDGKEPEPLLDGNASPTKEEERKEPASTDTPGKATVHYDADEVLPPCPVITDGLPKEGGVRDQAGAVRVEVDEEGADQDEAPDEAPQEDQITATEPEPSEEEPAEKEEPPAPKAKPAPKRSRDDSHPAPPKDHPLKRTRRAKDNKRKRSPSSDEGVEPAPKPKAAGKSKASPKAEQSDEAARKARLSRKSVAYHRAVKEAKAEGKSEEDAKAMGKIVLCLRWMQNLDFGDRYNFFEVFSGAGMVSKVWHEEGFNVASFDRLYGRSMDILNFYEIGDQPFRKGGSTLGRFIDKRGVARFRGDKEALQKSGLTTNGDDCLPPNERMLVAEPRWLVAALSFEMLWLWPPPRSEGIFGSLGGPAIARKASTFELAGNHAVPLAAAPEALARNLPSAESLDSYDSAVEDAQRRVPKLSELPRNTPTKKPAATAIDVGPPSPMPAPPKPHQFLVLVPPKGPEVETCQALDPVPVRWLELSIKKFHLKKKTLAKHGGYYTKAYLTNNCHWTKPMVEKAWQWAHKNNCLRKNEIHGEEEALLVLSDSYELLDQEGQELSMAGTIEMEDDSGFLLADELPSIKASHADIFAGKLASSSGSGGADHVSLAAAELVPTQHFGRALKSYYKELQNKQADAINKPFNDALLKLYANITKQDLVMNNLVVRARLSCNDQKQILLARIPGPDVGLLERGTDVQPAAEGNDDTDSDADLVDELFYGFEQGEWFDLSNDSQVRRLQPDDPIPDPFLPTTRLNQFPKGPGKGHDCSTMLGWLEALYLETDIATIAPQHHDIFKLFRWTLIAVGTHFRVLYRGGVFITRADAATAVECGWKMFEGYHHLARLAAGFVGLERYG